MLVLSMGGWTLKKEILLHLASTLIFFSVFTLIKPLSLPSLILPFLGGVILGAIIPDVDHLIYALFLHPTDLSSQRIRTKLAQKQPFEVFKLLYVTRDERKDLIFHNLFFVLLFSIFALVVVSSSGSIFGRGLVVSFLLHLLMDEIRDIKFLGNANSWFKNFSWQITSKSMNYLFYLQIVYLFLLSFLF